MRTPLVVPFEQLRMTDVERVGGKNASLGEMISQLAGVGIRVPGGLRRRRPPIAISCSTKAWQTALARAWPRSTSRTWRNWPGLEHRSVDGSSPRRCRRVFKPKSKLRMRS
jgi:hypothetical protein